MLRTRLRKASRPEVMPTLRKLAKELNPTAYQETEDQVIMSTRCHIAVYESEGDAKEDKHHALLYKHSDGYPEGVVPILEPFLKQFKEVRGLDDAEYLAAWTLRALMEHKEGVDGLGFGICTRILSTCTRYTPMCWRCSSAKGTGNPPSGSASSALK